MFQCNLISGINTVCIYLRVRSGLEMVVRPDHIACLGGRIGEEWASDTQKQLFFSF
jgi:hypothetical protein